MCLLYPMYVFYVKTVSTLLPFRSRYTDSFPQRMQLQSVVVT